MAAINLTISIITLNTVVKNLPASAGDVGDFDPWIGQIPWHRK